MLEEVLEGSADETDVYFGYGENGHTASSPVGRLLALLIVELKASRTIKVYYMPGV